jgi:hypothetical protein
MVMQAHTGAARRAQFEKALAEDRKEVDREVRRAQKAARKAASKVMKRVSKSLPKVFKRDLRKDMAKVKKMEVRCGLQSAAPSAVSSRLLAFSAVSQRR